MEVRTNSTGETATADRSFTSPHSAQHPVLNIIILSSPCEQVGKLAFLDERMVLSVLALEAVEDRPWRPGRDSNFLVRSKALVDEDATAWEGLLYHVVAVVCLGFKLLPPRRCMATATEDGDSHGELRRAKAPEDPLDDVAIGQSRSVHAHNLIAGVAEAVLRGHMDGGESSSMDGVHGVATGLKVEVADLHLRDDVRDARELCHLLSTGNVAISMSLEEDRGFLLVQASHAHLQGDHRFLRLFGGIVDVPLLARLGRISNHISIATRLQATKVAVEDINFLREAPVGSRLCAGEDEHPTRVLHSSERHAQLLSKLKNPWNGEQEHGSPTGLDHNLLRVDKQARLREHVRVEVLVGELGHNGAPCEIKNRVDLGPGEGTQATTMRVSKDGCLGEGYLKTLLVALKSDRRDRRRVNNRKDRHCSS